MKKVLLFILAFCFVACTAPEAIRGGAHEFNAVAAGHQVLTKTSMASPNSFADKTNSAGLMVNWNKGDKIAVFDTRVNEFTCASSGGLVKIKGDISEDFSGTFYAMYPYYSCSAFADGKYYTNIPENQFIADTEHWDPIAPVVVGYCGYEEETIPFYNANSLVAVYLPAPANSVTLKIYGEDTVSGDISVDVKTLEISRQAHTDNTVTITGKLEAWTPYYIALIPSAAKYGFSVYVNYPDPFTVNGVNHTAGEYHYKNNSTDTVFSRNRIMLLDMTEIDPERMGGPITIKPHLPQNNYIFRSMDGSVFFNKDEGGNSADKLSKMDSHIYDYNKQGPIGLTTLSEYQINQQGWHKEIYPDEKGQPRYRMQINGKGEYNGAYLKYDAVLQGFYMINNREDATLVYVYELNN